jgi:sec-independent protein translocase protein TatB
MFDIGFWELTLIGIIGLVVLGPERLPVAIRTIKGWISGVRKFSDSVKSELSEELRIHELHANLKKAEQADMTNLAPEVAESVKSLKEAAEMVNEPFKKVDKGAMDSFINTALASDESKKSNQSFESQNENTLEKSKEITQNTEHDVKQGK